MFDDRQKMCFRKKSYATEGDARPVAEAWGQRIYLCPHCYRYHLTKDDKEASVEIKRPKWDKTKRHLDARRWRKGKR